MKLPRPSMVISAIAIGAFACSPGANGASDSSDPSQDAGGTPSSSQSDGGATTSNNSDASTSNDSGNDAGAATPPDAGPPVTTIRAHYPAGSHALTIRGSNAPLNWTTGNAMTSGTDDTWTFTTTDATTAFEYKPLLDDATWSLGPNYKATPGTTIDVYPHFTQTGGSWSLAYQFTSTILGNTRGIWLYLPPTYIENTRASMPVLYMHDGQNLFDPSVAFGGNAWNVGQTMDSGANDGSIAEAIVVGIENTANRIPEYTPVADPTDGGGNGDAYLSMIITELKPHIDATLRTVTDRANTSMMGSSLGGLITAYAGVTHADVFGRVGIMSPSTWWDNNWLIGEVGTTPKAPRPLFVYLDSGDSGTDDDDVTLTASLAQAYNAIGYQGASFDYLVQAGGQHSEVYWAERLPASLAFLLGPGR